MSHKTDPSDRQRDKLLLQLLKTPPQPRKKRDRNKPKTPSVQRVESPHTVANH